MAPADEAEVQATVRWAVRHGLTVHPQSTGHGAYRPLDHGVLLTTGRLDRVAVDGATGLCAVGAGVTWAEVLRALQPAGWGAVTGSAGTVGAVGLLLGGGIGPVGRTLGMAADWVRAFRVVDARGEVLVASPDAHADLFWALRGGKVGLGVVTEVTLQAVRMPFVYGGGMFYREGEIDRLAHAWVDWSRELPESVNTSFAILRIPPHVPGPLGGATVIHVRFTYVEIGATNAELESRGAAALAGWRALAGPALIDTVGLLPSDRIPEIHAEPTEPSTVWEWGDFLREIDHDFIDAILEQVGGGRRAPLTIVEVRRHGGALARDPEPPTAIGGRREPYTLLVLGAPSDERPWAEVDAAGRAVAAAAKPWEGIELNYNWAGHPTPERFARRLWSAEQAARLAAVRAAYDPDRVFEYGN